MYEIDLELPPQCTVEDCILQALKLLNQQFLKNEFQLNEKPDGYEIYEAKKNGKKKEDYPCMFLQF